MIQLCTNRTVVLLCVFQLSFKLSMVVYRVLTMAITIARSEVFFFRR